MVEHQPIQQNIPNPEGGTPPDPRFLYMEAIAEKMRRLHEHTEGMSEGVGISSMREIPRVTLGEQVAGTLYEHFRAGHLPPETRLTLRAVQQHLSPPGFPISLDVARTGFTILEVSGIIGRMGRGFEV